MFISKTSLAFFRTLISFGDHVQTDLQRATVFCIQPNQNNQVTAAGISKQHHFIS